MRYTIRDQDDVLLVSLEIEDGLRLVEETEPSDWPLTAALAAVTIDDCSVRVVIPKLTAS